MSLIVEFDKSKVETVGKNEITSLPIAPTSLWNRNRTYLNKNEDFFFFFLKKKLRHS